MMYGWIIGLVIIIALVAALNKGNLFGGRNRQSSSAGSGKNAMDILKSRYAKGEISQSEYEEKKAELERS